MDAHSYNGDYDRDHESVEDTCDECGAVLYPEEVQYGRCRRCAEDALEHEHDAA